MRLRKDSKLEQQTQEKNLLKKDTQEAGEEI